MNNKNYLINTLIVLIICAILPGLAYAQERSYTEGLYSSISTFNYPGNIYNYQASNKTKWKKIGRITKPDNSDSYIKRPNRNPNLIQDLKQKQELARAQKIEKVKIKQEEYQQKLQAMCINSFAARRINKRGYRNMYQNVSPRNVLPFKDYRDECSKYINQNRNLSSNY